MVGANPLFFASDPWDGLSKLAIICSKNESQLLWAKRCVNGAEKNTLLVQEATAVEGLIEKLEKHLGSLLLQFLPGR